MMIGLDSLGSYSIKNIIQDADNTEDLSSLNNALSRDDHSEIIHCKELFWRVFCKAFSQVEGEGSDFFATSVQNNHLRVSGNQYIISVIQKCIEQIRKIFERKMQAKTGFTILPIDIFDKIFIREPEKCIDLRNWLSGKEFSILNEWFFSYVVPAMPKLSKALGANFSKVTVLTKYICFDDRFPLKDDVCAFEIHWINRRHLVDPIDPKKIPVRNELPTSMNAM